MDLYHCLNRGTEKRPIAMSDRDRLRFVRDLREMNDSSSTINLARRMGYLSDLGGRSDKMSENQDKRDRLVTVHAWCLMGNHYHLLLSDMVEGGISKFLMKFNVGYTKYFNAKYERNGVLFQGRTKRVLIESERQYLYILPYIHLNPLDFLRGSEDWRRQCPASPGKALDWVRTYRWSSYRNYAGETEFVDIVEGSELFQHKSEYVSEMEHFLRTTSEGELAKLNLE